MSSACRVFWIHMGACVLECACSAPGTLFGQPPPPPPPQVQVIGRAQIRQGRLLGGAIDESPKTPAFSDAITSPTDRKAKTSLNLAEDFIKEQSWGEAAR